MTVVGGAVCTGMSGEDDAANEMLLPGSGRVTITVPSTTSPMAATLSRAGLNRTGRRRSRTGSSSNRAESTASTRVTARRRKNSGQIERCVRDGVSQR